MRLSTENRRQTLSEADEHVPEVTRVLGLWAPAQLALALIPTSVPRSPLISSPDPDRMREIYTRHVSRLLP